MSPEEGKSENKVVLGIGFIGFCFFSLVWGVVWGTVLTLTGLCIRFWFLYQGSRKELEQVKQKVEERSEALCRLSSGDICEEVLDSLGLEKMPSMVAVEDDPIDSSRIMAELQQAVFVFSKGLTVENSTSDYAKTLFGDDIDEKNILDVLFGNTDLSDSEKQSAGFQIGGVFGMAKLQWKISQTSFPKESTLMTSKGKVIIRYSYFPRFSDLKVLDRIVVVVEDISDYKKTRDEVDRRHKEMEKIFSLIEVPDAIFDQYMEETSAIFDRIKSDLKQLRRKKEGDPKEILERMFRDVHTIKGNSKMFKFEYIHLVASDLEVFLAELTAGSRDFDLEVAISLTEKIMEINEEIYSYTSLRRDIFDRGEKEQEQLTKFRLQWIKSLIHQFTMCLKEPYIDQQMLEMVQLDLNRALDSFSRVSIGDYLDRYDGMLHELADKLGKKVVLEREQIRYKYFDSASLSSVNTALIHIFRNCLDHGLEGPEIRKSSGKDESGTISITTEARDHWVTIEISDDGAGINEDKVALKAVSNGLISRERYENMNKAQKLDLIFASGLSTKTEVTDLSGRGVGMDAVRASIREAGGSIVVDSEAGKGSRFVIKVPEKFEEFISSISVFDWTAVVRAAWATISDFTHQAGVDLILEHDMECSFFLLGEHQRLQEALGHVFLELFQHPKRQGDIHCFLESQLGRRDQDRSR